MKRFLFTLLFLPSLIHAIEALPDDKVDNAQEVSIVNNNFRALDAGKLDLKPKDILSKQDSTYTLGASGNEWLNLYVDTITAFSLALSSPLPLSSGGTSASLSAVSGGIAYSGGAALALSAAGSAGQLFLSGGVGTPTWLSLGSANRVLGINSGGTAHEYKDIVGTTNRVTVSHSANTVTLSGPQDIGTGSSPSFAGVTLSGLTADRILALNSSKAIESLSDLTAYVAGTSNRISVTNDGDGSITLNAPQDLNTSASFTVATLDTGQGANELYDMNQNVQTSDSVTFSTANLTNVLYVGNGSVSAPSMAFTNSTQTGWYRSDSDKIAASIGGVQRFELDNTGLEIFDNLVANSAGNNNIGTATAYFGDVSYKTLTDRGCLGWMEDGVELQDGRKVSYVQAIMEIRKHSTKRTIYGSSMLDYKTFPKVCYKPADLEGIILPRDENDEPYWTDEEGKKYMAADGVEMTSLFSIMLGAIKEQQQTIENLQARLDSMGELKN